MSITCSYTRGTKKNPCLFPQIIKTPEINVSNVFSVMIVPIVFEIQLSFCLQEKNIMGVISGGVRSVKHLEIPRFRDSPFQRFPVQRFPVLEIPPFRDSPFQRFPLLEIPRFRDSPFQRFPLLEIPRSPFPHSPFPVLEIAFEKSNATNFGNQTCHLRNQTRQILEIKRTNFGNQTCHLRNQTDKFWKSKVSFEKSNATNFGNQTCHLRNQTRQILEIKRTNFGNQTCHLRNQTDKFWKSKVSFEKSNTINS